MLTVSNVNVYGLDESIRGAKFPMAVDVDSIITSDELKYWLQGDFIKKFIEYSNSEKYPKYIIREDYVEVEIKKNDGTVCSVKVDEEDVPLMFGYDWNISTSYCKSNKLGFLHRVIMQEYLYDDEKLVVDHINGDKLDNRKRNLRLATSVQNSYNSTMRKNNTSGIMGVSWSRSKRKWRAYINTCEKCIHIGYYDNFQDAIKNRLIKEREICGSFAPQRHLFAQYGVKPVDDTGMQKTFCRLQDAISAYKNLYRLSKSEIGTGHDNALLGIIVQFDLKASNKFWVEMERYHFIDFVSSQSTMHRIAKFDLEKAYNEYVDPRMVEIMKQKLAEYNAAEEAQKPELYLGLLYSNPAGFELTARMTTNYRQLKTIYRQRKNHRLKEWRDFTAWIETLPRSELITGEA